MSISDHKAINFTDPSPHELEYILYKQLGKRATKENMKVLKNIGDDFKKDEGVDIITDRQDFYDYAKKHELFSTMENMPK